MIDGETLKRIARLNNLRPWQQEKHYVQSLVLVALSEHPLVFKGGTYLWFFHGLQRFSEDLDFTFSEDVKEGLPGEVSEALRLFGVENSIRKEKGAQGSFSFRVSAKGPLHTGALDLCHVYVEISRREKPLRDSLPLAFSQGQYGLPSKIIAGMDLGEVAAEKIRALMAREKGRDLYDLHFLVKSKGVKFDRGMADEKLAYYGLKFSQKGFKEKVLEKEELWKKEVKPIALGALPEFSEVRKAVLEWAGV